MPSHAPKSAQTSMRLTELALSLLEVLSEHYGISKAAVVEMLLRDHAYAKGILEPRKYSLDNVAKVISQVHAPDPEHEKGRPAVSKPARAIR